MTNTVNHTHHRGCVFFHHGVIHFLETQSIECALLNCGSTDAALYLLDFNLCHFVFLLASGGDALRTLFGVAAGVLAVHLSLPAGGIEGPRSVTDRACCFLIRLAVEDLVHRDATVLGDLGR